MVAVQMAGASAAVTPPPDFMEAFAASVQRRPTHVAVQYSSAHDELQAPLTYEALDAISNALAHRLIAMGVGRDDLVGISMQRGIAELVAMLAVAKAGGAYVPMVPSHPLERLRIIMEDAAPQVMIVGSGVPLAACAGDSVLVLDDVIAATEGYPSTPPFVHPDRDQLAYVMFTSGSTGRPKGVEITRGALSNFLRSMAHTPGLGPDDRLLAITTTAFDIAGLELLLPLAVGATVIIADEDTAKDPRVLRRRLEQGDITMLQATPATWRLLLQAGWTGDARLRMLCGGEAMSTVLADALLATGGELWNMYGPTETTIWSSLQRMAPGYDRITVGTPIDATTMVVLDEQGRELPFGQEGELGIGGDGLARGYRGRPELTRERFVVMPDGRRIYRTGDLARQLEDGRFECLGRLDHQVKIRGFRVELGEIEAILRSVSGVGEVVVVAETRDGGDPRLVAYWVGEAQREALIAAARRSLPAYMVPAAYVRIDVFPLNTNGKVDRAKLPKPQTAHDHLLELDIRPRLPRNDDETLIAAVWRDILRVGAVPRDENFFTLGGTSVLAVQVVARLERELGVQIPLATFYQSPTVEGLAAALAGDKLRDEPIARPIIVWLRQGAAEQRPLFCVFGVHLYQDLAAALEGDRPVIGMHVPFRYVPGRDARPSIFAIASRYVELIRGIQPQGPYDVLGLCFGGVVAYEVARQLESAGERVETVTVIDAILPTALRTHRARRLQGYLRSARRILREPDGYDRLLRRAAAKLAARVPLVTQFQPGTGLGRVRNTAGVPLATTPIDLPVDGPEVDAELWRFAAVQSRLSARLHVVRALAEPIPEWVTVQHDQGWGGRAVDVRVHDVDGDHRGVLQEPHVHTLAQKLAL